MSKEKNLDLESIEELYAEAIEHKVNIGGSTIHAKRMPGKFRTIKWYSNAVWLLFFLGPYFRYDGNQAILWDIGNRQFHLLGLTIMPQDIWVLSYVLLFFAILLFVSTAFAGRVWCGYLCFQTVWTDVFTWIEDKLEGNPTQRRKLDEAPLKGKKIKLRTIKYSLWFIIAFLTGLSFVAWFTDVYQLWIDIFTLEAANVAYFTILLFICGTFYLAGFLREQTCFWLCPYARIQAAMVDNTSIIPCYDVSRGEKRGRLVKGKDPDPALGDCIDCNQCVAVCPTGVDIRGGQQEGCIMCGMCIDACDSVMDKINRSHGLIRYASWNEMVNVKEPPLLKRPRVITYISILLIAISMIAYGLFGMTSLELKVRHERNPLYVVQSDGRVKNKYILKIVNKTNADMPYQVSLMDGDLKGAEIVGMPENGIAKHNTVTPLTIYVQVHPEDLQQKTTDVKFIVKGKDDKGNELSATRKSFFDGPK